jgi:large subunit ribosomal protein L3
MLGEPSPKMDHWKQKSCFRMAFFNLILRLLRQFCGSLRGKISVKFLLGTKEHMTQIFNKEGSVLPATILKVSPMSVTRIRTEEKDGYKAVQVGAGEQKEKRINKAQRKIGNFKTIKEFRLKKENESELKLGDTIDLSIFSQGDIVSVTALSKGKGFQGGVKRYGFKGGRRSHGNKHAERQPGSIGATGPQRVFKGTRMAGRMGSDKVTVKNLKVLNIDKENGLLYISGAVPGRRGTLVEVKG